LQLLRAGDYIMKRINFILMLMGIMAFALMLVGCGEDEKVQKKVFSPFVTGPSANDSSAQQLIAGATHELSGTIAVVDENIYRVITPSDYSGSRKEGSAVKVKMVLKVNPETKWIDMGYVKVEGEDAKGVYSYQAACYTGAKNCGQFKNGKLEITLFDPINNPKPENSGYIEFTSTGSNQSELTGDVVMDGLAKFGNFQLTLTDVQVKP